jgi:hypothetical protein
MKKWGRAAGLAGPPRWLLSVSGDRARHEVAALRKRASPAGACARRCRSRRRWVRPYVVTCAGFTRFHRATETPFNLIFEVRP